MLECWFQGLAVQGRQRTFSPEDGEGTLQGIRSDPVEENIWVVVRIIVSFWVPIIIRNLIFRGTQKGTIILTTTHMPGSGFEFRV